MSISEQQLEKTSVASGINDEELKKILDGTEVYWHGERTVASEESTIFSNEWKTPYITAETCQQSQVNSRWPNKYSIEECSPEYLLHRLNRREKKICRKECPMCKAWPSLQRFIATALDKKENENIA